MPRVGYSRACTALLALKNSRNSRVRPKFSDHYACVRKETLQGGRTLAQRDGTAEWRANRASDKMNQRERPGWTAISSARHETIRK
jgi:hypothetical protein